jgi:hypothetical protein
MKRGRKGEMAARLPVRLQEPENLASILEIG